MKKILLIVGLSLVNIVGISNANASDEVFTWTCSEGRQFKTSGSAESIKLTWESRTYDLDHQTSLPGSLRYKNSSTGHDLVVLGNKAMLFNIKTGTRLADFCQTAEMKAGKLPHLFADAEPFK
ncbi:hypothetical protein [Polynucleobacter sphagniphilus]|jgi:hypothetical protein|uniref:hypothetical protein n=1 Tax=Polynucleobacter sphagniphilus TaxID=1743169 RepID=UPI002476C24E|nr:hypothetical protein [Polynucleobacter sphagniphilus]MDH6299330.1 hypothetical protein [Polynucleobacter sphagniphilus]